MKKHEGGYDELIYVTLVWRKTFSDLSVSPLYAKSSSIHFRVFKVTQAVHSVAPTHRHAQLFSFHCQGTIPVDTTLYFAICYCVDYCTLKKFGWLEERPKEMVASKSSTAVLGAPCVTTSLANQQQELPASASALGWYASLLLVFYYVIVHEAQFVCLLLNGTSALFFNAFWPRDELNRP